MINRTLGVENWTNNANGADAGSAGPHRYSQGAVLTPASNIITPTDPLHHVAAGTFHTIALTNIDTSLVNELVLVADGAVTITLSGGNLSGSTASLATNDVIRYILDGATWREDTSDLTGSVLIPPVTITNAASVGNPLTVTNSHAANSGLSISGVGTVGVGVKGSTTGALGIGVYGLATGSGGYGGLFQGDSSTSLQAASNSNTNTQPTVIIKDHPTSQPANTKMLDIQSGAAVSLASIDKEGDITTAGNATLTTETKAVVFEKAAQTAKGRLQGVVYGGGRMTPSILSNASWDGANYNRDDTALPASLYAFSADTDTFTIYTVPAGANPIVWATTLLNVTTTGDIKLGAASAKIIPGVTSLLLRNNADSATNLGITDAGVVTVRAGLTVTAGNIAATAGNLTFGTASSKIIPGATSLVIRNAADSATNVTLTDAGAMTVGQGGTGTATAQVHIDSGSASGGTPLLLLRRNSVSKGLFAVAGSASQHITGDAADELDIYGTGAINFSASPATLHMRLTSTALTVTGNVGIGTSTFGTSATRTLALFNGTVPSTSPADTVQLFSVDLSAGNATLGIRTETAVVTESVTSDRTLSITVNGTVYKLCLKV